MEDLMNRNNLSDNKYWKVLVSIFQILRAIIYLLRVFQKSFHVYTIDLSCHYAFIYLNKYIGTSKNAKKWNNTKQNKPHIQKGFFHL